MPTFYILSSYFFLHFSQNNKCKIGFFSQKIEDEEGASDDGGAGGGGEEESEGGLSLYDPFFEVQDNHDLIGVANVFLECLFYDVTLCHQVPIINQQGEVSETCIHIKNVPNCSTQLGRSKLNPFDADSQKNGKSLL